jgi:tripartite-type tricarboxylate transporter receptor subunit TctC
VKIHSIAAALAGALSACPLSPALAQTAATEPVLSLSKGSGQAYPVKPIRLINGFPAGGGTDIMARLLAPKMVEALGQQIIIENRTGAGTNIAMEYVVKAAPDGYTLLMNSSPVAINMSLYKNLPFDTMRDLAAISLFAASTNVLVVHPSLPARSVKDLIALARAKPDELKFSSGSNGTTQHLSGELFKLRTGTRLRHVPYRGTSPSLTALIGGEIELNFGNVPSVLEYFKAGRLRALAVTATARSALLPQVPTMREAGVDMIVNATYSLHAPAATPRDIVNRLANVAIQATRSDDMRQRLLALGVEPIGYTPDETARWLRDEVAMWAAVVKASGAVVE